MNWKEEVRPQKADARVYALEKLRYKPRSLWLPGSECCCVEKAIELKVLDVNSCIILAERQADIVADIKAKITNWKWRKRPRVHHGELSDLSIPWALDFAFLDFLGSLTESLSSI